MCGRHPGRVERVGRMSGKGWSALNGGLPYHHHLPDGEGEAGRRSAGRRARNEEQEDGRANRWEQADEIRAKNNRNRRRRRKGRTGDDVNGGDIRRNRREARNWRRWRRNPSHWFSLFIPFCLLFCSALPLPPEGGKRTGTRRAGWQTVEALPFCWSLGSDVVAMWWRLHRPELDEVAARPSPWSLTQAGEVVIGWWWCERWRKQTEQKRGEELAKMAAASFALVPSLPYLLLVFCFSSIYNNVYIII